MSTKETNNVGKDVKDEVEAGKSGNNLKRKRRPHSSGGRNRDGGNYSRNADNASTSRGSNSIIRDGAENDPEWYAANPQLMKDAFNFPTSRSLGIPFRARIPAYDPTKQKDTAYSVPGIMRFDLVPVPGISRDGNSAVNIAANKLYAFIRGANSGAKNYDPADLMMYLLAMDNLYSLWNFLVRMYGCLNTYNVYNRYLPRYLIQAMGFDFYDMMDNLPQLRAQINRFSSQISALAVPAVFSYFKRHAWLFSNVYTDGSSMRSQLFLYNPSILYKWVERTSSGELGYLDPVDVSANDTSLKKFDWIKGIITSFLDPIVTSEDFSIMSGDIIKAFGTDKLLTVPLIGEDYQVLPVYSEEVMQQMENAADTGKLPGTATSRIIQSDTGVIIFNPTLNGTIPQLIDDTLINFHKDDVAPEDFAVATRLCAVPLHEGYTPSASPQFQLAASGSELVTGIYTIWVNPDSPSTMSAVEVTTRMAIAATGEDAALLPMLRTSVFNRHPIIRMFSYTGTGESIEYAIAGYFGNLDNFTTIAPEALVSTHDLALMSMFNVPGVASK